MLLSTPRLHSFSVTLETCTPGLTGGNIIEIIFKHDRHLISCLFCVWIIGGTVLTPAHIDNQKKRAAAEETHHLPTGAHVTDTCPTEGQANRELAVGHETLFTSVVFTFFTSPNAPRVSRCKFITSNICFLLAGPRQKIPYITKTVTLSHPFLQGWKHDVRISAPIQVALRVHTPEIILSCGMPVCQLIWHSCL